METFNLGHNRSEETQNSSNSLSPQSVKISGSESLLRLVTQHREDMRVSCDAFDNNGMKF